MQENETIEVKMQKVKELMEILEEEKEEVLQHTIDVLNNKPSKYKSVDEITDKYKKIKIERGLKTPQDFE